MGVDRELYDLERTKLRQYTPEQQWSIALQSLTPGGSEFAGDPAYCVAYVREKLTDLHEAKKQVVLLNRKLDKALIGRRPPY